MSAFAAATDALFADPNLGTDAAWRAGDACLAAATLMIDVRVSEIPAPEEGDTIELDGAVYVIQGEPIRDAERLVCTLEARAQ